MSRCARWSKECDALIDASVMRPLRSCMFVKRSNTPASSSILTRKSAVESDQGNMETSFRHRHNQLLSFRIPWRGTASLEMSCEQTCRHVGH
ncbi:hypothetical protein TNCV_3356761 [Trichonephila clavipes]|nr:hypothetical protein TNCV_3356761 [Trichonephila clavipes]